VTDPGSSDSDGDGWSDYKEIFEEETNPTNVDTDSDEAWDSDDRDPLKDIMLDVNPQWGYKAESNLVLQILAIFEFGTNDYYIRTPFVTADTYNSSFSDLHYYVGIDDDDDLSSVTINLQLWDIESDHGGSDTEIINADRSYTIVYPTSSYTHLDITSYMRVDVKTCAFDRANTIAIYGENSTFNGHYADPNQRFNVIQLNVLGEGFYPGSYNFYEDPLNATGTDISIVDWVDTANGYETYVTIESSVEETGGANIHRKVLSIEDPNPGTIGSGSVEIKHTNVDTWTGSGRNLFCLEFWWYTTDVNKEFTVELLDGGARAIQICTIDGYFKWFDGSSYTSAQAIVNNKWYHHQIWIDAYGNDEWTWYIDGVERATNEEFRDSGVSAIDCLKLYSHTSSWDYTNYFDAFGFSFDSGYSVGDNEEDYSTENTPFVNGLNVIVIPTELFTMTKLHGYAETDDLDQTPLYSLISGEFEFYAPGRNGDPELANSDVDFVFVRFGITPSEAMDVLDLLLIGVINETETGEPIEATINAYCSTKINDTQAVSMNLPFALMGFIAWAPDVEGSPLGPEPDPTGEDPLPWFLWATFWAIPIFIFVAFAYLDMTNEQMTDQSILYAMETLIDRSTFLGNLLWLLIRAALLILAFIFVGIHIAVQTIAYVTIGLSMLLLAALFDGYCEFSWNFVEFSINDPNSQRTKVIRMESNFVWVYWEFFDLKFPWVVDELYQDGELVFTSKNALLQYDSDFVSEDIEDNIESIQNPPDLHCNHNLIDGTTYDFWTIYDDSKKGGDDPDSTYGVKLHLIAQNGSALIPIQMNSHSDYLPNPDYSSPVKYHYPIDLSTLYADDGLWHYYFSSKDDSGEHSDPSLYPEIGYLIGPEISQDESVIRLIFGSDTQPGFKSDNFYFKVSWASDSLPEKVNLCLIPAIKDPYETGISRTVGINKLEMTEISEPFLFNDEYEYTANFAALGYIDSELGQFSHYFEAIHDDGNKTYLYETKIDADEILIYCDFKSPFVATEEPQLVEYTYYSAIPLLGLFDANKPAQEELEIVAFENEYYFEVIFIDPNNEGPPDAKLILENVVTSEEIEFDMNIYYLVTPFSKQYGEDAYSCMYHLYGSQLSPGLWRFRFEAKDGLGVSTNELRSKNKLWCIGSLASMGASFITTMNFVSNIPLTLFTTSALLANSFPHVGLAIAFVAGVFSLVSLTATGLLAAHQYDTGSLLGYASALFFSTVGFSLMSNQGLMSKLMPLKIGGSAIQQVMSWTKYYLIVSLIRQTLTEISFVGESLALIDYFWFPVEVITGLVISMMGRFALGYSKNVATAPIQSFLSTLPYLTMAYGIIASLIFLFKTQAYAFFF
jgi:hypothetical protein